MAVGDVKITYCARCDGDRNCQIRGEFMETGSEGDHHQHYFYWHVNWMILSCLGCDYVFVLTISTNSEEQYFDYGPSGEEEVYDIETTATWPAKLKRPYPEWFTHHKIETDLPDAGDLSYALKEVYSALQNDLAVLSAQGMRTVFDVAACLLGVDEHIPFERKLQSLVDNGLLRDAEKAKFALLIDAGNASAHRGWRPGIRDLNLLMTTLEEFIFNTMVFPSRERAKEADRAALSTRIPPRRNRPNSTESAI